MFAKFVCAMLLFTLIDQVLWMGFGHQVTVIGVAFNILVAWIISKVTTDKDPEEMIDG